MVYEWKMPGLYNVPAQVAGEELDRIYQDRGKLDAADVVDESRPEEAVLHPCFEWDDPKAAELYRQQQARNLINCIVTVVDTPKNKQVETRAFVHLEQSYHPLTVVVIDTEKLYQLKLSAFRELKAFRKKYQNVAELVPVFQAIDAVIEGDVS